MGNKQARPSQASPPQVSPSQARPPQASPPQASPPQASPPVSPDYNLENLNNEKPKQPSPPVSPFCSMANSPNVEKIPTVNINSRRSSDPDNVTCNSGNTIPTRSTNIQSDSCRCNEVPKVNNDFRRVAEEHIDEDNLLHRLKRIGRLKYDTAKSAETQENKKEEIKPPPEEQLQETPKIKYLDSPTITQKQVMDKYEAEHGSTLRFLMSYGFLKEHCLEALVRTNGDEDLSLILLYNSYINDNNAVTESVQKHSYNTSLQHRQTEIRLLEKSFGKSFTINNNRWTFNVPLKALENINSGKYRIKINFVLDFFLLPKYPATSPLILLKPNGLVERPKNFIVSKRLFEEAQKFGKSHYPCLLVMNFWQNKTEMLNVLKNEVEFIYPKVCSTQRKESIAKKTDDNISEIVRKDRTIVNEYRQRMTLPEYKNMQIKRAKLPAFKQKEDILKSIRNHQIIILKGETGCGKSTQIPQFIFDEWIESFHKDEKHLEIICTQPRRISALGVANRVANERVEKIGHSVGYQIRFDHCVSDNTRLTFCTMGVLLKRIQREPTLDSVTHIIVDEVHERSAEGDLLLLILKKLLPIRKDIRVILMSATVDTVILSQYFGSVPITEIPGRTFPVEQFFLEDFLEKIRYETKINSDYFTPHFNATDSYDYQEATVPDRKIEDEKLNLKQLRLRYQGYSEKTCQTILNTNVNEINYEIILEALEWIKNGEHMYPRVGTVLIFMPGYAEIFNMLDMLYDHKTFGDIKKYFLVPLHSSLPQEEQNKIFIKPKQGQSKIILSTNIAETSITIEDCIFVIDTGKMKQKSFDANTNIESLDTVWVSRANALQRKGRAGRVRAGVCIHLYTKHRFEHNFIPHPISEIQRIPVDSLILYMKVLINYDYNNIRDVFNDFIEPPPEDNIKRGTMNLNTHQVIDNTENLTQMGFHLASLPLDVMPGKLLIYGVIFGCLDATLTMAAYMSHKTPFVSPSNKNKKEVTEKKKSLAESFSDQITIFRVYRKVTEMYKENKKEAEEFLNENFLSSKVIKELQQIRFQLLQCLVTMGFVILDSPVDVKSEHDDIFKKTGKYNQNEENCALLSSILCAAFYPNIVSINYSIGKRGRGRFPGFSVRSCEPLYPISGSSISEEKEIKIDPKSVNFSITSFPYNHLIFHEKEKRSNKLVFQESTMVSDKSLVAFANSDFLLAPGTSTIYLERRTIVFHTANCQEALGIKLLREHLQELVNAVCKDPSAGLQNRGKGKEVVTTLIEFIGS